MTKSPEKTPDNRKTMHLPRGTHGKLRLLSKRLKRPMVDVIDSMADATIQATENIAARR